MNILKETQGKPSVLIVDDEEGLRDMLVFGLTDKGYRVITAANGEEALTKLHTETVDMVVCDIMMPGISGVDALKAIKELAPKTEVVMATGYATLETAVESMKLGAYDYIAKPYGLDQLVSIFEKAMERRRLRAQVGHLEELNKLKSEFLASMSHELRTPLNAILGFTTLIAAGSYGPVTPEQKQGLHRIEANSRNLLHLISNILDLSRLSAGRMPVYVEPVRLCESVTEVMESMESLAHERQLTLSANIPPDLIMNTDKAKLRQVLINLVGNAIKFTSRGGVTITAIARPDNRCYEVEVRDTGIGIAAADIPNLFQDFQQLGETTVGGGTGLGLSICKKIMTLLGGAICVESTPSVGTVFLLKFPLDLGPSAKAAPGTPMLALSGPEAGSKIVLGIDDDPETLVLMEDNLKGTCFRFVGARSAEEGFALAKRVHPCVIVLDVLMPLEDGWSFLRAIKKEPELRDIPIIVISNTDHRSLGYSLGISDYLMKPIDRQELLRKLDERAPSTPGKDAA